MLIHLFGPVILYLVYGTGINGHCTSNRDCTAQNAYCVHGTCICYRGYSSGGFKCLTDVGYGATCDDSYHCLYGTICSVFSRKCECPAGQTYDGNQNRCFRAEKSKVGGSCSTVSDCFVKVPNSVECTSGQCTCKSGYITDTYNCRLPKLTEPCQDLPGCGPNFTEPKQVWESCENGYCKCPDGSEQFTVRDVGITICLRLCSLKVDGDKCETHNECASKLCRRLHPGDLEHTCIPLVGHTSTPWYDSRREFSAAPKITGVISSFALAVTVLAASHYL